MVLSDADMSASTFSDGQLLRDAAAKDKLTSVKFPVARTGSMQSILVPNSVVNYSKSVAVPSTGGLAFVIESKTSPADAVKEVKDIAAENKGQRVYVVDIVNPVSPKLKFPFSIGSNPLSVDIYKNELIISTEEAGKKLGFLETDPEGKPTRLIYLPIDTDSTQNLVDVSFHPSGDFIAASLAPSGEFVLYKIVRDNGKLKNIETVGKPVKLGDKLTMGRFSADGKKYFVVDSKGELGKSTGDAELIAVNVDTQAGNHTAAGKVALGANPSSFALSPDGSLIAAAVAGSSLGAWTSPEVGQGGKVVLLKVGADGALTKGGEQIVEGIYPSSVAFDKDGSNLAVSIFENLDYGDRKGAVVFYTVNKGDATLAPQKARISVERGAHTLRVVH
ncbi:lactonase family protein [Ravibacter arvi]|uniref:Lactonase family protein n=1 Tax=Ravibacter arvi TaxID=2051041 RepID=A0ABP8LXW7_9BACT